MKKQNRIKVLCWIDHHPWVCIGVNKNETLEYNPKHCTNVSHVLEIIGYITMQFGESVAKDFMKLFEPGFSTDLEAKWVDFQEFASNERRDILFPPRMIRIERNEGE